jgi:acyl-[acyl carrier protein]--UDP-N-acetylglucosamine O-acyltransferase
VSLIHPTAVVDPAAELDSSVSVGPYSVIGPHVRIDSGTSIGPHCVAKATPPSDETTEYSSSTPLAPFRKTRNTQVSRVS